MQAPEQKAREYSRRKHNLRRKRIYRRILVAIFVLFEAILFAAGFMVGHAHAQCKETAPAVHERTDTTDEVMSEAPPIVHEQIEPTSVPGVELEQASIYIGEAEMPTQEETIPSRDDIVTEGRLLRYDLQEIMWKTCQEYGVPFSLGIAMAEVESHFDADVVSSTADYGLMQINKSNHEWLREMGFDPMTYEGNIGAGIYLISKYINTYGDTELALMAYNCGPNGARNLWNSGIYETDYTRKVMGAYAYWRVVLED